MGVDATTLMKVLSQIRFDIEAPSDSYRRWCDEDVVKLLDRIIVASLEHHKIRIVRDSSCESETVAHKGDGLEIYRSKFCIGRVGPYHLHMKTSEGHAFGRSWFTLLEIEVVEVDR